jgi:hypothetical protein
MFTCLNNLDTVYIPSSTSYNHSIFQYTKSIKTKFLNFIFVQILTNNQFINSEETRNLLDV